MMGSPLTLTAWRTRQRALDKSSKVKGQTVLSCSATNTKTYFFQTAIQEVIVFVHKPCIEIKPTATHTLGGKGLKYGRERVKLDVPVMV